MKPLNLDPVEIVTKRVLPSGDVEVLMRLSERDKQRLLADPGARYSIAPHQEPKPQSARDEFYDRLHDLSATLSLQEGR